MRRLLLVLCVLGWTIPAFAQSASTIPDFASAPDRTSTQAGFWDDTATWGGAAVPTATQVVKIIHTVTIRDTAAVAKVVSVDTSGTLFFSRSVDTQLHVTTMQELNTGIVDVGTEASPIGAATCATGTKTAKILFRSSALDVVANGTSSFDHAQYGNGWLLSNTSKGYTRGCFKTAFVRTSLSAGDVASGVSSIVLESIPVGWVAGDRLFIPDSRQLTSAQINAIDFNEPEPGGGGRWEEMILVSMTPDSPTTGKATIVFDNVYANVSGTYGTYATLQHGHECSRDRTNAIIEYCPHVGNLTRNVTLESETPTTVDTVYTHAPLYDNTITARETATDEITLATHYLEDGGYIRITGDSHIPDGNYWVERGTPTATTLILFTDMLRTAQFDITVTTGTKGTIQRIHQYSRKAHVLATHRSTLDTRYTAFVNMGRTMSAGVDLATHSHTQQQRQDKNQTRYGSGTCAFGCGPPSSLGTAGGTGTVRSIGANQIGRYATHFHMTDGAATCTINDGASTITDYSADTLVAIRRSCHQFAVIGNVYWSTKAVLDAHQSRWPLAVHGTNYGLVKNNVIYNFRGAAIMLEDGNEESNILDGNFIARGWGLDSDRDSDGDESVGIYFRGLRSYVRNNVVASMFRPSLQPNGSYGFKWFLVLVTSPQKFPCYQGAELMSAAGVNSGDDGTVNGASGVCDGGDTWRWRETRAVGIAEFDTNEVYGTDSGLTYWHVGAEAQVPLADPVPSVLKNFRVWNYSQYGIYHYHSNKLSITGLVLLGKPFTTTAVSNQQQGIHGADYIGKNWSVSDCRIEHAAQAWLPQWHSGGTDLRMQSCTIQANIGILIQSLQATTTTTLDIPPRVTILQDVTWFPVGTPTPQYIEYALSANDGNLRVLDRVTAYNHRTSTSGPGSAAGDNFQSYYTVQATDATLQYSRINNLPATDPRLLASYYTTGTAMSGTSVTIPVVLPGGLSLNGKAIALSSGVNGTGNNTEEVLTISSYTPGGSTTEITLTGAMAKVHDNGQYVSFSMLNSDLNTSFFGFILPMGELAPAEATAAAALVRTVNGGIVRDFLSRNKRLRIR